MPTFRLVLGGALLLATPPSTLAQPAAPAGSEFQINTYTTGDQGSPSVGVASDGDFVVVWDSDGSSGSDNSFHSIQGQRYASDGTTRGSEFQVNTYTTYPQYHASVGVDSDGDFVVIWESTGSSGSDTDFRSIQGQRYASDGTARGSEFQVNTYTTYRQGFPSVGVASDGDFVVVWNSGGSSGSDNSGDSIQGQRYASDGTARGSELQINTYTTNNQFFPSVGVASDGDFVVVWESGGSSGSDNYSFSIQGQRYASDGTARGSEFQINTYTTSGQRLPSVGVASDGDFVVVWNSGGSLSIDSIQGQRYASDGTARGSEFQINTYTTGYQPLPSVGVASDGGFVVVWFSDGSSGSDNSFDSAQGQRYASDGTPRGTEFQVNTYTTGDQSSPSVGVDSAGGFVVVWASDGSSGSDSSDRSIQGQRYFLESEGCSPDANALCIDDRPGDRRFKITLHFDTALGGGQQGEATATPLSSLGINKGGILAFTDPKNPEVLVKVLNGCNITNHYWVFYAATTTVGFELTVEDTVTGLQRFYTNPDLMAAETVTDTSAFATCP